MSMASQKPRRQFLKKLIKTAAALQVSLMVPSAVQAQFVTNSAWRKKGVGRAAVAWGLNGFGQIGDGTTTSSTTPVSVLSLTNVVGLSGGDNTLALLQNGCVASWGGNCCGSLGYGSLANRMTPGLVCGISTATAISSDGYHALALLANGSVVAWGNNDCGQLGNGTYGTCALTPSGVSGISTAVAIAGGGYSSYALLGSGTVMGWGDATGFKLGNNSTIPKCIPTAIAGISTAIAIAAGLNFGLALLSNGTLKFWGCNNAYQAGDTTASAFDKSTPVAVCCISTATAIATGGNHLLALLANGCIMSWGDNVNGQLGQNNTTNRCTPFLVCSISTATKIAAGYYTSYSILQNGTLWSWGDNVCGVLGDGTTVMKTAPVQVGACTTWVCVTGNAGQASGTRG